jgi:hypothetical protein
MPNRVWSATAAIVLFLLPVAARAAPGRPHLDVTATWHDNASNANRPGDQIDAVETRADLTFFHRVGLARNDSLHLTAHAGGSWWPRFSALHQHTLGGRADWQHKFGLGPQAPIIGVELSAAAALARDRDRRGTSTAALFSLRKRFAEVWRATLTQDFARHDARSVVYDRAGSETAVIVDRSLGEAWHFAIRGSYRDGDVLSHGTPPRPDLVALASNRIPVTTFGRAMVAYSIEACSMETGITLTRALGPQSSARVGYGHRETSRSHLRYGNNFVSAGFAHQF